MFGSYLSHRCEGLIIALSAARSVATTSMTSSSSTKPSMMTIPSTSYVKTEERSRELTSTPTRGPTRTVRSVRAQALALRHLVQRARNPSPTVALPRRLDPPSSTRCPGRDYPPRRALSRRRQASAPLPPTVRTRARSRTPASQLQTRRCPLSPLLAPAATTSIVHCKSLTTTPLSSHGRRGSRRRPRRRARSTSIRTEGSPRSRSARSHRVQACTSRGDLLRQLALHRSLVLFLRHRLRQCRNPIPRAGHSCTKMPGAQPPLGHRRAKRLPLTLCNSPDLDSPSLLSGSLGGLRYLWECFIACQVISLYPNYDVIMLLIMYYRCCRRLYPHAVHPVAIQSI